MKVQTISTKELREDFSKLKSAMEEGRSLLLLYRSRPLAEIKPVRQQTQSLRSFSLREIKQWIADDQLTEKQQRRIEAIINRLP
jgi:antitoxin (DNA-binding transcriptional repressor) of toxin-antitoxin stability system